MKRIAAIVPAAGLGTRMGAGTPKQFLELEGVPIVVFTLRRLAACPLLTDFWIPTRPEDVEALRERVQGEAGPRPVHVLAGGETRQESVARALAQVPADCAFVLIHDAVRPLVSREIVERVLAEAERCGAALAGLPAVDTVKEVRRASLPEDVAVIVATLPRERIVLAQTPQAFTTPLLREAVARAVADGFTGSDEAVLVERLGHTVHVVLGSERNVKITRPADLELVRFYLRQERCGP